MRIKIFSTLFLLLAVLSCNQAPKYSPDWESLSAHNETPEWFKDAKLGIYFHWGVYSVPAFGSEWYPRNMFRKNSEVHKHHLETYGDPSDFGCHDFIPLFRAEHFDPEEWAQLFKNADGTIPDNQKEVLRKMGRWLDINGEAVYGTRPWKIFGQGPTWPFPMRLYSN